jgi:hypothetical protein
MSPPHIPKIGPATVPVTASSRQGGQRSGGHQPGPEAQAQVQAVQKAVVVNRSLELLETMAGRVSEATGENLDVSRPADGDSAYRVQLMSFIVGSLSRASQAFRQKAAEQALPEPAEEAEEQEEAQVEAALPEEAVSDPVEEATEAPEPEEAVPPPTTGYGSKGQAVPEPQEGKVKTWA